MRWDYGVAPRGKRDNWTRRFRTGGLGIISKTRLLLGECAAFPRDIPRYASSDRVPDLSVITLCSRETLVRSSLEKKNSARLFPAVQERRVAALIPTGFMLRGGCKSLRAIYIFIKIQMERHIEV